MDILKKENTNLLYDCYSNLLTEKQREYYEMYFFNDFSLGEIADSLGVSRNAVHDQIKKTIQIIEKYEVKLQIIAKRKELEKQIDKYEKEYNVDLGKLKNLY